MKKLIILYTLCALILAGCASIPARASLGGAGAPSPTGTPVAPPRDGPTATATALPPPAMANPDLNAPPRVGLQVGHWKIEDHHDEMARLRKFSGAYYNGYDEWEVNIVIAEAVRQRLEAAGVTVDLLPARVPIGYTADAFLSIHVDGVTGAQAATRRGWKVAAPFRASQASLALAATVGTAYQATTGLPEDREEASFNLRAYYAFASYRYWHSIAASTPAAIIEVGFMTHPGDHGLIFDQPDLIADGIARGVFDYLAANYPLNAEARAPVGPGMLRARADGTALYERPNDQRAPLLSLTAGQQLVPVDEGDGWYLVFTHGGEWDLGWVRASDVEETGDELVPPHPRPED